MGRVPTARVTALALVMFSLASAALIAQSSGASQPDPDPPPLFEFSGLVFGDIYGVPSHHLEVADGRVAAWIRRAYLTGDFNLSPSLFVRVRGEINQDGDFVSNGFTIDFKDVHLRWTLGRHRLFFGLAPSPSFDLQDSVWGYRHLERTPLDGQGIPSRDLGIAAHGPLNASDTIRYRLMVGTGKDFGRETGEGRKLMGAVSFGREERGLLVDVYGDFQRLPGETDTSTGSFFAHYRLTSMPLRLSGLYTYQHRQDAPRLVLGSAYAIADVAPKLSVIGRIDRLFAPSPDGDGIDYLPFDTTAKATFLMGGIEWRPWKHLSLTPNVQAVLYDAPSRGQRPRDDVYLRVTFYLHY